MYELNIFKRWDHKGLFYFDIIYNIQKLKVKFTFKIGHYKHDLYYANIMSTIRRDLIYIIK